MLSNIHTHTTLCDGKSTPEEVVLSAIERGFVSLGFSAHAPTGFDSSYCLRDLSAYRGEVFRLREKYRDRIEIYLGIEEDGYCPADRSDYDYIIGSFHYVRAGGRLYPVDCGRDKLTEALGLMGGDRIALATGYYEAFCDYIARRRPDVIGHFDLLTKYDEKYEPLFLGDPEYERLAESYIRRAAGYGCIFEVNTGAISRGYRLTPYPAVNLLRILKKEGARIILTSDSHRKDTLDCHFTEAKKMLRDIGFSRMAVLYRGEFRDTPID